MKKLILGAFLLSFATLALADHDDWNRRGRDYDHHEWHEHNRGFGWGEFLGGIVLGGIIAHEVGGHYYDSQYNEIRQVTVCENVPIFDVYGNVIRFYQRCHQEWVRINQ